MTLRQDILDMLAQVAKALGNGHRLAILERLAQTEASVDTLATDVTLTVGNTSAHLQHLRRAGLVSASRSGKHIIYRLTDERIVTLISLLRQVAETNLAEMERLLSRLFATDDAGGSLEAVSQADLLVGLRQGCFTLLDVRSKEEYQAGHLPDAINIPFDELEKLLETLPREREIVAYCRGPYCVLSHQAAERLRNLGYRVRRFTEGYPQWKAAGLPIHC